LKAADFVYLSDTALPNEQQVVLTCGLRGLTLFDVHITGAKGDLHSGLHGGVLRNPIQALAEIIATLHTPEGKVNVPGFYDDVLDVHPWERDELKKLGGDEKAYAEFLGIDTFYTTPGFSPFESSRFQPTLEFNGIGGGYQGEGTKTVIPSKAFAKISCRLVPNQQPDKIKKLVMDAIRARTPKGVKLEFVDQHKGEAYVVVPPGRSNTPKEQSPVLARAFLAADKAIAEIWGRPPIYLREGGSVLAHLLVQLGGSSSPRGARPRWSSRWPGKRRGTGHIGRPARAIAPDRSWRAPPSSCRYPPPPPGTARRAAAPCPSCASWPSSPSRRSPTPWAPQPQAPRRCQASLASPSPPSPQAGPPRCHRGR
jgi:hypothetical protein